MPAQFSSSRTRALTSLGFCAFLFGLMGFWSGCKKDVTIPGTQVPDTEENREVLKVLERYRIGFSEKDAAVVLSTAHPTYFDTAGTDDPGDDITYETLGPLLKHRMAQMESLRFSIDYIEIHISGERAVVHGWIDASFRLKELKDDVTGKVRVMPRYMRKQDYVRFELLREGRSWRIISGL